MTPESDPVSQDEFILRLVWHAFYLDGDPMPVKPRAFYPRADESTGISVFRAACVGPPADILMVLPKAENRPLYVIAALAVSDLKQMGLTVTPDPIPAVPGHAVLTELNAAAWAADQYAWKAVADELARLASGGIVHQATGK